MLTEICQYLRNWFCRQENIVFGHFTVVDGNIANASGVALPLLPGQYFRIVGSVFNDGVHKYGEDYLNDEEFSGAVWPMAVPEIVINLADEIEAWNDANEAVLNSPYQSESFGGYSYSLKDGSGNTGDFGGLTWQSQFRARLNPWRKI